MKKTISGLLIITLTFVFSSFLIENKEHDKQLFGVWKGFEKDREQEGLEKHWILQRFDNGKYVIMFTTKQDCDIETFSEKGEWWTQDGKFYEKSEESKTADTYSYEVRDKTVNFKSVELNGKARNDYNFTDYKVDLD